MKIFLTGAEGFIGSKVLERLHAEGHGLSAAVRSVQEEKRLQALILGVLFAAVVLIAPELLSQLNPIWYGLGPLLSKIVSPIVLGIIFLS